MDLKSGHTLCQTPNGHGGSRPNSGAIGLHNRINPEQMERICALIRTGRATVEAAICSQVGTTHASIYRSRELGMKSVEKEEQGEALTANEESAKAFYLALCQAVSEREIVLTRQALCDDKVVVGVNADESVIYANPAGAKQAIAILQLTCRHWRIQNDTEQKVEHSGTIATTTDLEAVRRERQALEARLAAAEADNGASE